MGEWSHRLLISGSRPRPGLGFVRLRFVSRGGLTLFSSNACPLQHWHGLFHAVDIGMTLMPDDGSVLFDCDEGGQYE